MFFPLSYEITTNVYMLLKLRDSALFRFEVISGWKVHDDFIFIIDAQIYVNIQYFQTCQIGYEG